MSAREKPQLEIVGDAPELDMANDIYAMARAEISAIDWKAVHIRSDRSAPIELSDRPRVYRLMRRLFSFEERKSDGSSRG